MIGYVINMELHGPQNEAHRHLIMVIIKLGSGDR